MSLIELKQYLMKVRMATLTNLCAMFKTDPENIRCLLQHWIRKGKVRQCLKKPACGTQCFQCPANSTEMYEWVAV